MRRSIATVSLSGTLPEKLEAIAFARFDGVEIFENDFLFFAGTAREQILSRSAFDDLEISPDLYRWHPFNRQMYFGARVMLPGHLLASKGDRIAMHSSVEKPGSLSRIANVDSLTANRAPPRKQGDHRVYVSPRELPAPTAALCRAVPQARLSAAGGGACKAEMAL